MSFGLVKHNNNSISAITSAGQLAQGKMTLIKEQTASSSSSVSFVDGSSSVVFDNTYPIYLFKIINCHPSNNDISFQFQASTNSGSSYGVTITSTHFRATHGENGSSEGVSYIGGGDLAQSTSYQLLAGSIGSDNDQSAVAELFLFGPSSTTFVKNFLCRTSRVDAGDYAVDIFMSGYFNTTSAIDAIQFKMDAGTIDSGTIEMYGIN